MVSGKSLAIGGIALTLLGASITVSVITVSRWQQDAQALRTIQGEKRALEQDAKDLRQEVNDLRDINKRLSGDLEQIEKILNQEMAKPSSPSNPSKEQSPASANSGETASRKEAGRPGNSEPSPQEDSPLPTTPATADEIREVLKNGSHRDRHRVFDAITKLADPAEKLALLREIFALDRNHGLKARALRELGKIGGAEAATTALEFLETKPRSWLSRNAAEILAKNADATMMPSLYTATTNEFAPMKWGAAVALKKLGDALPLTGLMEDTSAQLANQDGSVRHQAVRTLALVGDPVTLPYLAQALDDTDSRTRSLAIWGIGNTKDKAGIPYLEKMLQDENASVKKAAERAIHRINNPNADNRSSRWREWRR